MHFEYYFQEGKNVCDAFLKDDIFKSLKKKLKAFKRYFSNLTPWVYHLWIYLGSALVWFEASHQEY